MNNSNYTVSESFYKIGDYNTRLPILLNADKQLNPFFWKYPVTWSGRVGWLNVSLIQTSRDEIDLSALPDEMIGAIQHIKGGIERAIKKYID